MNINVGVIGFCVKNALTDPVALTLTFRPQTMSLLGYPKIIPCTNFEHFGIIRFFSYAPDKQTNRRTSYSNRVGAGNYDRITDMMTV